MVDIKIGSQFRSFHHRMKKIRFSNKNFEIQAWKVQNRKVESFSEMFCFKIKFPKSVWNFHWCKILLQWPVLSTIFPFDLTYATSNVENFNRDFTVLHSVLNISRNARRKCGDFLDPCVCTVCIGTSKPLYTYEMLLLLYPLNQKDQ